MSRSPLAPRALLDRVRTGLAQTEDAALRSAALRFTARAEQVLDRIEDTTRVLEQIARTELALLERLGPIVDDLGALVRLSLEDTRRRMLGAPAPAPGQRAPKIIDVP